MSSLGLSQRGKCPECKNLLVFRSSSDIIECPMCNHRNAPSSLLEVEKLDMTSFLSYFDLLKRSLSSAPRQDAGPVKVHGISSYECKLLSPLLTTYGMDTEGNAKLLRELPRRCDVFDPSALCDRTFSIEEQHLSKAGYGIDKLSSNYLSAMLKVVYEANDGKECLVPLHADGDGHCLVHAISRCLVGRELFWHALRLNLHRHLQEKLDQYKEIFADFIDTDRDEWNEIIDEARPEYRPPENSADGHGLRPIHIFALANVLRRPIILLDGMEGLKSSCEYAGVYLPILYSPEECCRKGRDGAAPELNKPIAIAWSSSGHNHYVPLVAVQGSPPVRLPAILRPKVSVSNPLHFDQYIKVESDGSVILGGEKSLSEGYIRRLTDAMRSLFLKQNKVASSIVADVYYNVFRASGAVQVEASGIVDTVQQAAAEDRLLMCLACKTMNIDEGVSQLSDEDLLPGGQLHAAAAQSRVTPRDGAVCSFPSMNLTARYEAAAQRFLPESKEVMKCTNCDKSDSMRRTDAVGKISYKDSDRTLTPSAKSNCPCGFKHFWGGNEYDNIPYEFTLVLDWKDQRISAAVLWFENESNPDLNSNAYKVASELVNKHFPHDFGSLALCQRVVQQILNKLEANDRKTKAHEVVVKQPQVPQVESGDSALKTILVGSSKTTLHKEELTVSRKEQQVRQRISDNAAKQSKKGKEATELPAKRTTSSASLKTASTSSNPLSPSAPSVSSDSPRPVKVRVSMMPGGKSADLEFNGPIMPADLQGKISEKLGVPVERQRLRHGFPPRELKLTDGEAVELKHGEKLSVEDTNPSDAAARNPLSPFSSTPATSASPSPMTTTQARASGYGMQQPATSSLFGSLATGTTGSGGTGSSLPTGSLYDQSTTRALMNNLMELVEGVDKFPDYRDRPEEFQGNGTFMRAALDKNRDLQDNAHIVLGGLPNKIFAYNKPAARLELCLGAVHLPMSQVAPDHVRLAELNFGNTMASSDDSLGLYAGRSLAPCSNAASSGSGSGGASTSANLSAGGSGVVNASKAHLPAAFSGHGHRMDQRGAGGARQPVSPPPMRSLWPSMTVSTSANSASMHTTLASASSSSAPSVSSSTRRHHPRAATTSPRRNQQRAVWSHDADDADDEVGDGMSEGTSSVHVAMAFSEASESEGEEVAYRENPKKRQCKPSSLIVDALEQRIHQLTRQANDLQCKLVEANDRSDTDQGARERKERLLRQIAKVNAELQNSRSQLDGLLPESP